MFTDCIASLAKCRTCTRKLQRRLGIFLSFRFVSFLAHSQPDVFRRVWSGIPGVSFDEATKNAPKYFGKNATASGKMKYSVLTRHFVVQGRNIWPLGVCLLCSFPDDDDEKNAFHQGQHRRSVVHPGRKDFGLLVQCGPFRDGQSFVYWRWHCTRLWVEKCPGRRNGRVFVGRPGHGSEFGA